MIGILLFLVPTRVKPAVEAAGNVVAPLAIVALGAAIYTLYRHVLNQLILSPFLLHPLHALIDRNKRTTNPANLLAQYGVPRGLRHHAYVQLRRGFFQEDLRLQFDRNHTEATVVWITSVECISVAAILFWQGGVGSARWKLWSLLAAGCLTFISAVSLDISLFKQECRALRAQSTGLADFLANLGVTSSASSASENLDAT